MALTAVLFVLTLALAAISAVAAQHGGMPSMNNTGGVLLSDQCVVTPSTTGSVHGLASADPLANLASDSASCEYYQLPHHTSVADLDNLCTMMPFMSACSVRDLCAAGAVPYLNASGWCKPFSLLAHVCSVDEGMSKMKGCVNYNRLLTCILLCNVTAGMVVIQCKAIVPLPNLPSTMPLNAVVKSICEEMPYISGCEKCSYAGNVTFANCDLLSVYSQLCRSMPTHTQCFMMNTICAGPTGNTTLGQGWSYTAYQGQTSPLSIVTSTNGVVPSPTRSMTTVTSTSRPSGGRRVHAGKLWLAVAVFALPVFLK